MYKKFPYSKWYLLLFPLAVLVVYLYYKFDPLNFVFPRCPFEMLTGFYCPGCGSQRAIHQLLHGHWLQALDQNALLVILLPMLIWHVIVMVYNSLANSKLPLLFTHIIKAKWVLVLVLAFWVLRNLPVSPFNKLAPDTVNSYLSQKQ